MADKLTIALAQMNQRVGDLESNAAAMLEMRRRATDADLLVCPELQVIGYPPEDLVLKPEFVRRAMESAERLVDATAEPGPAMLIGTVCRVGGQDELVFDGSSFVMHPDGELVAQMPDWEETLLVTEWARDGAGWRCDTRCEHELDAFPADVYRAMMVGLRDYVTRNGFPGVILGLS